MSRFIDADALYMDVIHSYDYCDDFIEMIEQCPTADVRPNVPGEWLPKWSEFFKRTLPYCSRCLQGFFFETDFCPNCGADMRKGEKNEMPEMRK